MSREITLEALLEGCADDSFDDGIRIDTELEPLAGPGTLVKPAVYEGGKYQTDRRWQNPGDTDPTPVIVIDNVPSQANRLEDALRQHRESAGIPELVLDLAELTGLPAHLPKELSSLQFPHRNADAYLRDALLDGEDFLKTELGKALFAATPQECGALVDSGCPRCSKRWKRTVRQRRASNSTSTAPSFKQPCRRTPNTPRFRRCGTPHICVRWATSRPRFIASSPHGGRTRPRPLSPRS